MRVWESEMKDTKKNSKKMAGRRKSWVIGACREARQVDTRRLAGITVMVIGVSVIMTFAVPAPAAEWTVQPSVSVAVGRDNNPTLSPGVDKSVSSTQIAPRIQIEGATETSGLKLDLAANATKYSGADVEDTDEQRLTVSSFNQATERARLGLDAELRREILYQHVGLDSGTGDLHNTDVGLAQTKVRRNGLMASPSWSYALSELSSIGLAYRADNVKFTNAVGTDLVNYKQDDFSAEYRYKIGVQDDLNVRVSNSRFRPDGGENEADTSRLLVGWTRAFTETANGRVFFGPARTTEKSVAGEETSSGFAAEVGASQRSELTTLDAVVSRDVQPSGAGRSVESAQLRLYYGRKLSPQAELVARAQIFRNKVLEGADPAVDRRYIELVPEFRWQLAPDWYVSAAYVFRRQKFDAEPDTAESKAIFIGVAYAWRRFGASR